MNNILKVFIIMSMLPLALADTATLTNQQGQIYYYTMNLTKSQNVTFVSFSVGDLVHNYTVNDTIDNCTVTNQISCTAAFVLDVGNFSQMNVYNNNILFETLNLSSSLNIAPVVITQKQFITVADYSYLLIIFGVIATIIISGNVIYYWIYKDEIISPLEKMKL